MTLEVKLRTLKSERPEPVPREQLDPEGLQSVGYWCCVPFEMFSSKRSGPVTSCFQ